MVVVPAGTTAAAAAERRVVLLAGEQLSEPAADFAFETARELRAQVEVVLEASDGRVFSRWSPRKRRIARLPAEPVAAAMPRVVGEVLATARRPR
ncbi:MAG TPA: hypothetical protein VFN97_25135 [Actinospica sp.]|nr:hypothetical protein [Actinospica sp.]